MELAQFGTSDVVMDQCWIGIHLGEYTVLSININYGIKEPTPWYQNCNNSQILILWWVSQGERIFMCLSIIWVNTILHYIDTKAVLHRYKYF